MNDDDFLAGLMMGALFGALILFGIAGVARQLPHQVSHRRHIEAVEAGHACWVVSPDGTTTFEWLEPCGEKKEVTK